MIISKKKMKKDNYFSKIEEQYKTKQIEWKSRIKSEPKKSKRFWKWIFYWTVFPFVWIWVNIRDWRTALIFVIVFLLVSSEVWVPYLIGIIAFQNEPLRITMFSVGSACWLFWLGPGTPFLVICIALTIGIKGLFNKIKVKKKPRNDLG